MTKQEARQGVIDSGIFGKEFVIIWEKTYEKAEGELSYRISQATADTVLVLNDNYQIEEGIGYDLADHTMITHAFVNYTGYIME